MTTSVTSMAPQILIVDDSAIALSLYQTYLTTDPETEYQVVTLNSSTEALELCRRNPPDLILLDYAMPHLTGLEFLEELRSFATPTQVPVIVVTMFDSADLAVQVMKAGAQDCLLKMKLTPEAVRRSVRTTLEYHNLQLQLQQQRDLQSLLSSITLQIRQFLNLDEILETLTVLLRRYLKADRVLVCILTDVPFPAAPAQDSVASGPTTDPDLPHFSVLAIDGDTSTAHCHQASLPKTCRLLTRLAQQSSFPSSQRYHPSASASDPALETNCAVQSQLTVPIMIQEQPSPPLLNSRATDTIPGPTAPPETLWGWLVVEQLTHPRQWTTWESQLLEQLAVQVSIAIQQAELYDRLQNWNNQLESRVEERTQAIRMMERKLRHLNRDLEQRVARRTRELQVANERFEQLVTHINEVFWILNLNPLQMVYVSPGYQQIWGQEVEQLVYMDPHNWLNTVHPSDRSMVEQACAVAAHIGEVNLECRILRPDRTLRWVRIKGVAIEDEQGLPTRFVGMAGDITERKNSQAELTRQRDLREAVFNEATDALLLLEPLNYQIVDCNERAVSLFDTRIRDNLVNQPLSSFAHGSFSPRQLVSLTQELQGRGAWYGELEFQTAHGLEFWGNVAIKVVHALEHPLYLARVTDVTSQKEAESRIYKALREAEEVSELKSRFISMTSHEFRTPLSVIASSAGILQSFGDRLSPAKQAEHLETIQSYVQHTTRLLDDILLLNQTEMGKLGCTPLPLNVVQFCSHLFQEMAVSSPEHDFQYHVVPLLEPSSIVGSVTPGSVLPQDTTAAPASPAPTSQFAPVYLLDEKLLRQILVNLISNAIKYSPNPTSIDFTLTLRPNSVTVQIQDHGIGIPEKDLPQLFDAFHRAANVGTLQGTGLGLSIVKRCLDLHHGEISVQSTEGEGSCFTATIPTRQVTDTQDTASLAEVNPLTQ